MSSLRTYVNVSDYQNFQNISDYKNTINKLPFGYHYDEHRWTYIYNYYTQNIIGKIIANNNYHNVGEMVGGFCNNSYVMFIDKEYDMGTIQFILNFKTNLSGTLLPLNVEQDCTFVAGSFAYYLKPMKITLLRENVILNINIDLLPTSIPPSINNSQVIHVIADGSKFQTFRDVSDIDEKISKIPFGYHFKDIKWVAIQNETYDIIGKYMLINNFHSTDTLIKGGYCNNNIVIFIEKDFPFGSLGYTYNFINPENNTDYIKGSIINPTITSLTGAYYGKYVTVTLYTSLSLIRDIYFTITPPF